MRKSLLAIIILLILSPSYIHASVTHIWPESGTNDAIITAHIFGSGFNSGVSSVRLIKSGLPNIYASSINVISDVYLTCNFNLNGVQSGVRNLGVFRLGLSDTLDMCFTINEQPMIPWVWGQTDVGTGRNWMIGVAVGDGNNDAELEIYGACDDDTMYQFKWNGSNWDKTYLGAGGNRIYQAAVGDGNNDGDLEVYGACHDNQVYQFKWNGMSWVKTDVGSTIGYGMSGVTVGDGNNDGEPEVYAACDDNHIYQFKWNGLLWNKTDLGSGWNGMAGVAVGDGNNDAELEVYGACYDNHIYQFKWNGMTWDMTDIGAGGNTMYRVAVGDGNNDADFEIYGACADYHIYQFKWNGMTWDQTDLGAGGFDMFGVAVGDGNNDTELEVYGACYDHHIYQFKWNGMTWDMTDLGSGGNAMYGVAVGEGNEDGRLEVYGACWNNHIYQFRIKSLQNISLSDTTHYFGYVYPGDSLLWQYLLIENNGEFDLVLDSIISTSPVYSVSTVSLPHTISPEDYTPAMVKFKPTGEGSYPGTLLVYSDDPNDSVVYVYLQGFGDATPPLIESTTVWNDTNFAGPYPIDVKITDNYALDTCWFYYKRSEDPGGVGATLTPAGGNWYHGEIPVVYLNPDTIKYYIYARDSAHPYNEATDPPGAPINHYEFIYSVTDPKIALSDSMHDFSYTVVEDTATWQYLSLKNIGADTLIVNNVLSTNSDFSVFNYPLPDTILVNDSSLVEVIFVPSGEGLQAGTLSIYSNDPADPIVYVYLQGTGDSTPPAVVTLISPRDSGYYNNSAVNFIWHASHDNISGIDYYSLQCAFDSNFNFLALDTNFTDTTNTVYLPDSLYYWMVKAVDSAGNEGDWSGKWSFEIDTDAPTAPHLIQPVAGIYLGDTTVTFTWSEVKFENTYGKSEVKDKEGFRSAPVRYVLEVDTISAFPEPVIIDTLDTNTTQKNLAEDDRYFWRVKAFDLANNQSPYSGIDSFGIDITTPVIESTTVWNDTSFTGPFSIDVKIYDNIGLDTVLFYYERTEDANFVAAELTSVGGNWFNGEIPQAYANPDTIKYYIYARDIAEPYNASTDPVGAPANYYEFIVIPTGIMEYQGIPEIFSFELQGNPTKGKTYFNLAIPSDAFITLRIYDITGRLIDTPIADRMSAGHYQIPWSDKASSGVYFFMLESPWQEQTGKLVLLK